MITKRLQLSFAMEREGEDFALANLRKSELADNNFLEKGLRKTHSI